MMPCYNPINAYLHRDPNGKQSIYFKVNELTYPLSYYTLIRLPCGRCIGCRLERSRQWAARICCEQSLYDASSFLTMTYDDANLPRTSSGLPTLQKRDPTLFLKRLRKRLPSKIRYYLAGEYGDQTYRPHYHMCLFGEDFVADRQYLKCEDGYRLYTSVLLSETWGLGHCLIGDLTFESAAYVARYTLKKVNGKGADEHYQGRVPEYSVMSRRPGIGGAWFDQFDSDVYPSDELVSRGKRGKPPRYFDERLRLIRPDVYDLIKSVRAEQVSCESDIRLATRGRVAELNAQRVRSTGDNRYA